MTLKIQTDEQVTQWMADNNISGFVGDYYLQAQLEADLKEYNKAEPYYIKKGRQMERERTIKFIDWLDNGTRSSPSWRSEVRKLKQALKGGK